MSEARVRRRHVFFVGGFDPKGGGWYHGLFRKEAERQGAMTGWRFAVSARERGPEGNARWSVHAECPHGTTETYWEHVRIDDIVRAQWPRSAADVLRAGLATYAMVLAAPRQLLRAWRAAPRTLLALALPAAFWVAVLLASLAIGWATLRLLPFSGLAVVAGAGVLAGALAWERRLHTSWLLRIHRFAHDCAADRVPGLRARIDALAARIAQRCADPTLDEVLVVGFSVGSFLAASAVARALPPNGTVPSRLSLLTLGNCIPLLGLMPQAHGFRDELRQLSRARTLRWSDFSAPADWGSFALVDPLALCLGARAGTGALRLASPRFHTLFSPSAYRRLRRDKRRMHLQYLMAGERAGDYDFFALTAGPWRLGTVPA